MLSRRAVFALGFAVGYAFTASACGDDPALRSFLAERPNAVAHGAAGDTSPIDTGEPPDDTVPPGDTDTPDTADTQHTQDTADTQVDTTDTTDTTDTQDTQDTGPDVVEGGPRLDVPATIALPWVRAGAGGSELSLALENLGEAGRFSATLSGDASLHLDPYNDQIGDAATLVLRFDGASFPSHARGTLRVSDDAGTREATVWAVAGADLPAASWSNLSAPTLTYGRTATVHLETAPFPDGSGSWSDDSVNVFVPDGYVDRGAVPFVVHFHGHGTTLASTLPYHKYREQLWASGVNAVLVTPQGPVEAASGNFGKLMEAGGLEALLSDVVAILYRDGLVKTPLTGDLVLTEHSGGYQAVALNLGAVTDEGQVLSAHLFDGLYGYSSAYEAFVRAGGYLRSDYTSGGGTLNNNLALVDELGSLAWEDHSAYALKSAPAAIWFTPAAHGDCTWWEQAYAEALRWGATNARRGPRIELRTATASGGVATVTWFAPDDDWTSAHSVEVSSDGFVWTVAASVDPSLGIATFPLAGGRYVRVRPEVDDLDPASGLASDTYWIEGGGVLVVDGFDRYLGGSWHDLRHDSSARVGRAARAGGASNEAVVEGDLALDDFAAVIWLLGDESVADHTFTAAEQAVVNAYLAGGGHLIVSGSEVAYDLKSNGASFLSGLGAVYSADDANQSSAKGVGRLAALGSFGFGGPQAPYAEDYPDVLTTASSAEIALQYGNGMTAAAGKPDKSVVVGFPLEVIDDEARLAEVVEALLGFVGAR